MGWWEQLGGSSLAGQNSFVGWRFLTLGWVKIILGESPKVMECVG